MNFDISLFKKKRRIKFPVYLIIVKKINQKSRKTYAIFPKILMNDYFF